jgi:protein TonB
MQNLKSNQKILLKRALIGVAVLASLFLLAYSLKDIFKGSTQQKRQVTTIKLLPDTPPPPPPPPPKEPPKDQPKEVEKAPEPKPVETPPMEALKMEGTAGDGASPFQSGKVTNNYIGSDGGSKFTWYAGVIKSEIQRALERNPLLKNGQYKAVVSVWLKPTGEIERISLQESDAGSEVDQAIKLALESLQSIKQVPPAGMPQPVKLRITAKK